MKSLSSCDNDSINSKLSSMHRNSHNCAKSKPKIRVIHIIAPEIIKTDVENFRDLVQRLTGRHAASDEGKGSSCSSSKINEESPEQMKMSRLDSRMKGEKEDDDEHQVYGGGFGVDGFVEAFGELPAAVFPFKPSQLNAVFGEMPLF